MSTQIIMPQMGESIAEGTVTKWLKKVGDTVKRDEPIFEISTDKVDAEIPSPVAGTLLEIKVTEGQTVAINTVVGVIGEAAEQGASAPAPQPAAPQPPVQPPLRLPSPRRSRPLPPRPPAAPRARAPSGSPAAGRRPSPAAARVGRRTGRIHRGAHPAPVLAAGAQDRPGAHDRDRRGRGDRNSQPRDQERHPLLPREPQGRRDAGRGRPPPPQPPRRRCSGGPSPREPPTPRPAIPATDRDEIVAMTKIRRITAENMILSKRTSAHVTTVFQVDYTNIAKIRAKHKDAFLEKNGVKLTYLPFIFRAAIQALRQYRQLNASIDGDNIVYHRDIHLGMAVALDWGLIVPVIKNADEKSILGLARASQDLAERARTKRLKPEEIQGGTFTVTNPGVFGSLFGTPIIPQPQVAILGVGTIEKRPVVVTDENGQDAIGIRTVGYLALSFDHRLVDGSDADQFMASVKKTLETGEFDLG